MNRADFETVAKQTINHCWDLLFDKSKEYANDEDRLANFKQATSLMNTNPARVCMFYATKHIASMAKIAEDIDKGIYPSEETLTEKVGDFINYGLLFQANVLELLQEEAQCSQNSNS